MVFEVSSVGTKQTTDLIFDYYFLDEIQDISRVGCRFCLIGMLLLNTNGWCCSDWRSVAAVPVYKSWHLSLCNNNNYLQHQSRPDSRPACHPAPLLQGLETGLTGFVPSNCNIWEVPMVWYWYECPRTMRSVVTPVAHLGTVPLCWGACRGSDVAKYSSHIAADFAFILRIIYEILICSFLNCNLLFCFLESRVTLYLVDCNGRG